MSTIKGRIYLGLAKILYALPDILAWASLYFAILGHRLDVATYLLLVSMYLSRR